MKMLDRYHLHKKLKWITRIYFLLMLIVFAVMLDQIRLGNFENVFLCILTLFLFLIQLAAFWSEESISMFRIRWRQLSSCLSLLRKFWENSNPINLVVSILGYHAAYRERLFVRRHRAFPPHRHPE